jgi:hypothetical protein
MLERAYKYVQAPKAAPKVEPKAMRHDVRHPKTGQYCKAKK